MPRRRRGFAPPDLLALLATVAIALALALPALSGGRSSSQVQASLGNLAALGFANALYAADWNGRQWVAARDDLTQYGNTPSQALAGFEQANGGEHPGLILGWGWDEEMENAGVWGFYFWGGQNPEVVQAIDFNTGFGNFRMPNTKGFHDYVDGRWYGPTFYAPADTAPYDFALPMFGDAQEYVPSQVTGGYGWSSYCFSAATMYNHLVLRAEAAGGFLAPFELSNGTQTEPVSAAAYPDLKTRMIEHNWNQSPPAPCNPAFQDGTYDGCEPYYFNMGIDSAPATLFFDGHVRILPNREALIADQAILAGTGGVDGLWHRGTPMGPDGYFIDLGYDGTPLSHHVLTTNGIFGRDTISMPAASYRTASPTGDPLDVGNGAGAGDGPMPVLFRATSTATGTVVDDLVEEMQ